MCKGGVQSALGQVSSQIQTSEARAQYLASRVREVENVVRENPPAVHSTSAPLVVPVTVNVDTGASRSSGQACQTAQVGTASPAGMAFQLEPLSEDLTPFPGSSLSSSAPSGGRAANLAVRPVTVAGSGGVSVPVMLDTPVVNGDPVRQLILRNLQPPKYEPTSCWAVFEQKWNNFWNAIAADKKYSESDKLAVFKLCLPDSVKNELELSALMGDRLGFHGFMGDRLGRDVEVGRGAGVHRQAR